VAIKLKSLEAEINLTGRKLNELDGEMKNREAQRANSENTKNTALQQIARLQKEIESKPLDQNYYSKLQHDSENLSR
jgi:molecular chaperone GrpE (heat shock protein)